MSILRIDDRCLSELAKHILRAGQTTRHRHLVGIAGIPGSGKSTLARRLVCQLNARRSGIACLVSMDGFHLSNRELDAQDLRHRKGAVETFKANEYVDLLCRVRWCTEDSVPYPIYDRQIHEPVMASPDEHVIGPSVEIVVTEGNYLLLDAQPWLDLGDVLDECWWLDTPMAVARRWLLDRHTQGGRDGQDAIRHYESVDRINSELVLKRRRLPDRCLRWPAESFS